MLPPFDADTAWALRDDEPLDGAFTLANPDAYLETAVVTDVARPWLVGYAPTRPNGRAMLVLGGGGYTSLMVGREGIAVARWLTGLGYHAYVLIHRFPNVRHGSAAPLADAVAAMLLIRERGSFAAGVGVVGLSSGGHLAACLVARYPDEWKSELADGGSGQAFLTSRPDALIIGYAPISTNAKGRTLADNKPPLLPLEKQALYDQLQPDAQIVGTPPPTFIVYSGNDSVVPVQNAHRLHAAFVAAGGAVELHVFANAPHGFALDTRNAPVEIWPSLCEAWLRQTAFL